MYPSSHGQTAPSSLDISSYKTLFVQGLNPEVTDEMLADLFGKHGLLGSIKIVSMDLGKEETQMGQVKIKCAHVTFMDRKDAEKAFSELNGKEIMSFKMKLKWSSDRNNPKYPICINHYDHELAEDQRMQCEILKRNVEEVEQRYKHQSQQIDKLMDELNGLDENISEIARSLHNAELLFTELCTIDKLNEKFEPVVQDFKSQISGLSNTFYGDAIIAMQDQPSDLSADDKKDPWPSWYVLMLLTRNPLDQKKC